MSFEARDKEKIKSGEWESFEKSANEIIEAGLKLMKEKHDPGSGRTKVYHRSWHPERLQKRAEAMANIFGLSPERGLVTEMAIAWHDTIIEFTPPKPYDPENPETILGMIARHRGAREGDIPAGAIGNEALSVQKLEESMRSINEKSGRAVFSEEQIKTAVRAIHATYSDAKFDAQFTEDPFYEKIAEQNPNIDKIIKGLEAEGLTKGALFSQPHLESSLERGEDVPEEVVITALADLGSAGIAKEPKDFFQEGDEEYQELTPNIAKNMDRLVKQEGPQEERERAMAVGALQKWLEGQIGFATWQMIRFEKILYLLRRNGQADENKEAALRNLFGNFEQNIMASLERAKKAKAKPETESDKETFLRLVRETGYDI